MVAIETVAVSAGVSLVVSLASFEYRLRRERRVEESDEVANWYAKAAQLASSVKSTWHRKFTRRAEHGAFTDFDEVQREMNLHSNQLARHADEGTTLDVDETVITELRRTADACRAVHDLRITTGAMDTFRETGQEAIEQAATAEQTALEEV